MQVPHGKEFDFENGELLLVDKPENWTSFDVVNKIRHLLRRYLMAGKIKVGHAGTLDPQATGLLLVCTGKMTKRINDLQGLDKKYTGKMILGATTPSYDGETDIDTRYPVDHITDEMIYATASSFLGEIMQTPPAFSAVKIEGTRAYKLAREEVKVEIQPREVTIRSFSIDGINMPEVEFTVECSKGTYIRSLAHDFGKSLNSGAFLKTLRRTRIGDFDVKDALDLAQIEYLIIALAQHIS